MPLKSGKATGILFCVFQKHLSLLFFLSPSVCSGAVVDICFDYLTLSVPTFLRGRWKELQSTFQIYQAEFHKFSFQEGGTGIDLQ